MRSLSFMKIYVLLLVFFALLNVNIWAKQGDFVPSFGEKGKVTSVFFGTDDYDRDAVRLSDGSFVSVGFVNGGSPEIALVRYTDNGDLIYVQHLDDNAYLYGMHKRIVADADDNLIVLDKTYLYSFDKNGIFSGNYISIGGNNSEYGEVAVDQNNKFLASIVDNDTNVTLRRFNNDLTIDNTFATNGVNRIFIGSNTYITGVDTQSNGKIIILGSRTDDSNESFILRYNANGTKDTSFGTNAKVTYISLATGYFAMCMQNDKILAVGEDNSENKFVFRFNADGSLDTSFGNNGKVDITSEDVYIEDIEVDNNGKIILSGEAYTVNSSELFLMRLNSNGSLDTSFSSDGSVSGDFKGCGGSNIFIDNFNNIVLNGGCEIADNFHDFAMIGYLSNGSVNTSFANNGSILTDLDTRRSSVYALAIKDNSKILVAGSVNNGSFEDFALIQYNSDGSVDENFAIHGRAHTDIGAGDDIAYAVTVDHQGKIVLAGTLVDSADSDFALVRYGSNGALDTSFSNDGKVQTDFGSNNHDQAFGVTIDSQNRIVAAGYYTAGSTVNVGVARYMNNGTVDVSFDSDGILQAPNNGSSNERVARAVVTDKQDNIIIAGFENSNNLDDYNFLLMEFASNGQSNFTTTTSFGSGRDKAYALALGNDEKIVVVGSAETGVHTTDFAIARYNSSGALDTSFSGDGKTTLHFTEGDSYAEGVAMTSTGKIVVTGYIETNTLEKYFAIVRYNSDGSFDTSFANGGVLISRFENANAQARAVAIAKSGKIVIAGDSIGKFALAELEGENIPMAPLYYLLFN